MALIDDLRQLVQDEVNRIDMAEAPTGDGSIDRKIRETVREYHQREIYNRDLVEDVYVFETSTTLQQINMSAFPSFRKIAYIRPYIPGSLSSVFSDSQSVPEGSSFEEINVERWVDGYGYDRANVWYLSGANPLVLNINSAQSIDRIVWGYYRYPVVEPIAELDSWIALEYKRMVAWNVAHQVFISLGKDAEADRMAKRLASLELTFLGNQVISK